MGQGPGYIGVGMRKNFRRLVAGVVVAAVLVLVGGVAGFEPR